jgi:cold shock protein
MRSRAPGASPAPDLQTRAGVTAGARRLRRRVFLAQCRDRRSTAAIVIARESDVASGTVKWFNGQKGYGFIAPDGGGKDVFVHISAVERAGLDGLPDGTKVTFDIVPNRGKESAENLRVK